MSAQNKSKLLFGGGFSSIKFFLELIMIDILTNTETSDTIYIEYGKQP